MTVTAFLTRLLVLCALAPMPIQACAQRSDVVVKVGSGELALDLELSFPTSSDARGIVVIVPGSGGLSDPYFDSEIQQPSYAYAHRGGLTDLLTGAGYAVAAYSVRGYRGTSCVPADSNPAARAQYFVQHCVDQTVRGTVSLSDITQDTKRVLSFLRAFPSTSRLRQIALAYSEGMFHLLEAYSGDMTDSPSGIVAIGGPHQSLRATLEYQLTREAYFQLIRAAFKRSSSQVISADEILTVNHKDDTFDRAGLVETMGAESIDRHALKARESYWRDRYHQLYERFAPGLVEGTMDGVLDGARIEKAWAIKYYSQLISDDRQPADVFRRWKGSITYLYGADDVLVAIPTPERFAAAERDAAGCRKMQLLDHADHGLAEGGMPARAALQAILRAVNTMPGS